jgi:hypothetical protein
MEKKELKFSQIKREKISLYLQFLCLITGLIISLLHPAPQTLNNPSTLFLLLAILL